MRLSVEQKRLAEIMIWAVDVGYFNYGDSVIYLPKSDKFKINCSDLDKPIYQRLGAFYHDWLKLDKQDQDDIKQAYEDDKDYYAIRSQRCGFIFETKFKSFASVYRVVYLNAKKTNNYDDFEIDYYQYVDNEQYTRFENILKNRGIKL